MDSPTENYSISTNRCDTHVADENHTREVNNSKNSQSEPTNSNGIIHNNSDNLNSEEPNSKEMVSGKPKSQNGVPKGCPNSKISKKTVSQESNTSFSNGAQNSSENCKNSSQVCENGSEICENGSKICESSSKTCANTKSGIVYISPLNSDKFVIPDAPRKCQWSTDGVEKGVVNPHSHKDWHRFGKIQPDVMQLIGNTPMVKLNNIPKKAGIKCNIYAKLEYFNPGGSVKDRVAKRIIEDYENQGILKPGMTIIEPSSGNTGVGVALASAIKGYKCIIVMCEKMSTEKIAVINALGAKLIKTPITADSYSTEGIFGVANRLHKEIPDSIILDQFSNPGNPLAHYDTTAEEILDQCDQNVDVIVLGAGTGGTVTGIARKFKEKSAKTKVIGVDPEGSVFAIPESMNKTDVTFFEVEGLGYDFIPTTLDQGVVDIWAKSNDFDSLTMARRLIREEGLLCGTSSGAAVSIAIEWAKNLKKGQNLVVLLPDSIRNYLTKFVNDIWMEARGFQEAVNVNQHWWWDTSISKLNYSKVETNFLDVPCGSVCRFMKEMKITEIAVLKRDGNILGALTLEHLMKNLITKTVLPTEQIEKCTVRIYPRIDVNSTLGLLSRILEKDNFVIVTKSEGSGTKKTINPVGIIKTVDLFDHIAQNDQF